tara:strand:+ start:2301 stop:3380 length:1080 start_codon:yes stop_codon:yes gene_type:complete
MTVRVSKPEFNLREKLSELDISIGNHGSQLMKSSSPEESFFLTQAGRKNHIINGSCIIWQRANASIVQTDFANYGCDRFWFANGATQVDRSTETPDKEGFTYSMKVTQSSTAASIGQAIELTHGGNSQFKPGQRYTLSVWAKTDSVEATNLTFVAYYRNSKFSGTDQVNWQPSVNPFAGQITRKWKRFSCSFIAPEVNSNNTILALEFSFSATAYFTGFQFEEGDLTPFEYRTRAEELAACQRYYQIHSGGSYGALGLIGRKSGSSNVEFNFILPHPLRGLSTGTWTNTNGIRMVRASDGTAAVPTAVTVTGANTTSGNGVYSVINIVADTTSFNTGDVILQYASGGSNNQKLEVDAEL